MEIAYSNKAISDINFWKTSGNLAAQKRISSLIASISDNPYSGIGKPESLKGDFSGCWSRRIDEKNRVIYEVDGEMVKIHSLRGHYLDK